MKEQGLLRRLGALGLSLFEVEKKVDANLTLADVVKSGDLRLWEAFPVVLANSAEKGLFDYKKTKKYLTKTKDRSSLESLAAMSLALYKFLRLKFTWTEELYRSMGREGKRRADLFFDSLKKDLYLKVSGRVVSVERLKAAFSAYFRKKEPRFDGLVSPQDELGLEYALSQVFSPKQKDLFLKKLKGDKLTKTEREYFSRAVKRKVVALSNPELHRLSQNLL